MAIEGLSTGEHYPTLVNVAKRTDPDGSIAKIAELLAQTNEILDDAFYKEGNLVTGHRTTVRSDVPRGTWRKLNYGIKPSKSRTTQVTDTTGMLENRSEIDVDLAALNNNTAEFRLSEDFSIIEGLNLDLAETIFYGDTAENPERFLGLAPRYDNIGTPVGKPVANNYLQQVINGGGAGANGNTSIWLVVWGEQTCHMIYPKGLPAGLQVKDLGEIDAYDEDGGVFRALATHYKFKHGMTVRDWRYIVRIANVDPDADLDYKMLLQAMMTIPNLNMGRAVFYMNRAVKFQLEVAALEKQNAALSVMEVFGKTQPTFRGIPIKQADAISLEEAVLPAP